MRVAQGRELATLNDRDPGDRQRKILERFDRLASTGRRVSMVVCNWDRSSVTNDRSSKAFEKIEQPLPKTRPKARNRAIST